MFKETKKLPTDAVSALSHAVSASCQQRKDTIKAKLNNKFYILCKPAHLVSVTQLFVYNLNSEMKESEDSKKVSVVKKRGFFKPGRKHRYDRYFKKCASQEDFRRGFAKKKQVFSREKGESASSK